MNKFFSNRNLALIFAALALCAAAAILLLRGAGGGRTAVIYSGGEVVYRINLGNVTQAYEINLGGNTVLVEPGAISVKRADCPDKLCVRQGKISGGVIACLPNKLLISVEEDKSGEIDAVVK